MWDYLLVSAALSLGQTGSDPPVPLPEPPPFAAAVEQAPAAAPARTAETLPQPVVVTAPLLPEPKKATPAAAAPAAASAAGDRWLLMRALQGTWPGAVLDDHRMTIYGWTAMSYTASSASKVNTPVVWNDKADQFLLQQHWTRFERSVVTSGTTEPTLGLRTDWLIGSDYRFTLPRGIFNNQFTERENGLPNDYGIDPIQFYVNLYIPTLFQGTNIMVGRCYTPFGVESLEAVSTPTVSRSYAFNWAPPFT